MTTVKRWVDGGVLPAHRTAGGHRKLLVADVVRLARETNLPRADLDRLRPHLPGPPARPESVAESFRAATLAVDGDAIRSLLHAAYRAGTPVETLADRVVGPAMAALGRDWEAGTASVMTEHRVTQAVVAACYELQELVRVPAGGRPVAVGGAPAGDHYVLPSLLAKLTLRDAGWEAVNLGPHTPLEAFAAAVEECQPRLLWVSASYLHDPEAFLTDFGRLADLCASRGVTVVAGGCALTPAVRNDMGGANFGDGLTHLAAVARTLHRPTAPPARGRPAWS